MQLHRLHVATLLGDWEESKFSLFMHETEKLLDFYSEQGQLFCFVVSPETIRDDCGDLLDIDPERKKTYCVIEKRCKLPKVGTMEDLKFVKIIPPRWVLFELIDLEELGKDGVSGFNFKYPGILRDAGDLWKAIAKGETEKNA